jgi:osmotically-inducible protein OsmY
MRLVKRIISAELLLSFSLVMGCQTISEKIRSESPKDAAVSSAVKEKLLTEKAVDLTRINVQTTDGAVELTGVVKSLEARDRAVKLAWQATGVQSVVNHLRVEK